MKKVRITINKGSSGKKIPVFNSPESLYVWLHDLELQNAPRLDPSFGSVIFLRPGEVMEVEWMGCEFIHEDGKFLRIDQIRLAKTINVKSFKANNVVGVYKGWVTEEIIPFKSGSDDDIKRTKLTERSKHKFNIQELFAARGIEEKEEQHSVEPQDLH